MTPPLTYRLDALSWDAAHHFNAQNRYSYSGSPRRLGDPMLQCEMCMQWFHNHETRCLADEHRFVPFQRNYRFVCRVCANAEQEQFELLPNTWSSIFLTALHNLQLPLAATNKEMVDAASRIVPIRPSVTLTELAAWIRANWGSLCFGRHEPQLDDLQPIVRSLAQVDAMVINISKGEVRLRHLDATKLALKPLKNQTVSSSSAGSRAKRDAAPANEKRGKKQKAPKQPPPTQDISQIKLPEKYKLVPAPRSDPRDGAAGVRLSRVACAPQITLFDDLLTATGYKGYRMVRATHCVTEGTWYYEVRVDTQPDGEGGHVRIGWSTEMGELQAPVGYDQHSYSYRDVEGTKFHQSLGAPYGESYGSGDVIGCLLRMGNPPGVGRERQRIMLKGVEYIVQEERERTPSVGSAITFYKNGVSQGTAFTDIEAEPYFPAASLYKSAVVTFNFGPDFNHFPAGVEARAVCELAEEEAASEEEADEAATEPPSVASDQVDASEPSMGSALN